MTGPVAVACGRANGKTTALRRAEAAWFGREPEGEPAPPAPRVSLLPALDWGEHHVLWQPAPCRICGGAAYMTGEDNETAEHKVCAEAALVAAHGLEQAIVLAGATVRRRKHREGAS